MLSDKDNKNDLLNWKSRFGNDIHIERKETEELLRFLDGGTKPGKDSVMFLVGNAGMGKTVVMSDVLKDIEHREGWHTIVIKADMMKLENDVSVFMSNILKSMANQPKEYRNIIIIDQIDALSQCLSSNRQPLNVIDNLIEKASETENTKVLVSCRPYDMNYDPILRKYRTGKSVFLQPLSYNQVADVLGRLGRKVPTQESKLALFLSTPLHLELFLQYGKDDCEIVSLQSLFDSLWSKKITNLHDFYFGSINTVYMCVNFLADTMYKSCRLSVDRASIDHQYEKETAYLLSEGVLVETSEHKEVMFMHQSLFDYVYARIQYESQKSITEILRHEHQGLFVRNRVKQMLAYCRESDVPTYMHELSDLLVDDNSNQIRFHIKMLILSSIGSFEDVLISEKKFVEEYIMPNKTYWEVFVEGANSEQWFETITNYPDVVTKIKERDNNTCELIFTLCRLNIYQFPSLVINYLASLVDFNDTLWNRRLFSIVEGCHTDSCVTEGISLYYAAAGDRTEVIGQFYLRQLVHYDPKSVHKELYLYATEILKKELRKKKDNNGWHPVKYLDRNILDLMDELWIVSEIDAFELSINLALSIELMTKFGDSPDRFITSSAYYTYTYRGGYSDHEEMVDKLITYLIEKADVDTVKNFYKRNKKTSSSVIFYVLLYVVNSNVERYRAECLDVLLDKSALEGFGSAIAYQLEELTKKSWDIFDDAERKAVLKTIRTVAPKAENIDLSDVSVTGRTTYKGYRRFSLLSMIPNIADVDEEAFEEYEQLKEEYKEHVHSEPFRIRTYSGWTAMDIDEIKESDDDSLIDKFTQYENDKITFDETPSLTGNCQQLEALSKQEPERYMLLAKKMLKNKELRIQYPLSVISGLLKSNLSKREIVPLIEESIALLNENVKDNEPEVLMRLIRMTEDLLSEKCMSDITMKFLCDIVKFYPDDDNEDYKDDNAIFNVGINRVRGAAAFFLVKCYVQEQYKEAIFEALETCKDASLSTKGAIIFQQAFLNNLDTKRNLELYLSLIKNMEIPLLKIQLSNAHPLLYFINTDFDRLRKDFFPEALKVTEAHNVFSVLLWIAWVRNLNGAKDLLFDLLDGSNYAVESLINYFDKNSVKEYSKYIMPVVLRYVDSDDEKVGVQYDFFSRDALSLGDLDFVTFMNSYTEGKVLQYAGHSFLETMKKVVKDKPREVLGWICKFIDKAVDKEKNWFFYSDALSILTTAYNSIGLYVNDSKELEEAMNTFDSMLMNRRVRLSLRGFLNQLDS